MSHSDVLNILLSSDPNEPAVKGELLLLRAEMKAGFRTIDERMGSLENRMGSLEKRMDGLERSINLVAEQVLMLVQQVSALVAKS